MSEFVQRIERAILEHRLFGDGQAILVAVSGGLDSMVLLEVLHELAPKHGWDLKVAHFNHRLRGRSSDADERLVRDTAEELGLSFFVGRENVREFAREKKMSLEMAGRELRHEFLARTAREQGFRAVALAHHADDQVELFFVRLLRGAGAEGLAGMNWSDPSPFKPRNTRNTRKPLREETTIELRLVRPLLGCTKEEIRAYARERGIKFREDASNAVLDFQRNRIRHELIPLLKKHYQPALGKVILRVMEILRAEDELLDREACEWLEKGHLVKASPGGNPKRRGASLPAALQSGFECLGTALQRRILQSQLRRLGLPVEFDLVENLRSAADDPVNVSPEICVFRDQAGFVHTRRITKTSFNSAQKKADLTNDRGDVLFHGVRIQWERRSAKGLGHRRPRSNARGKMKSSRAACCGQPALPGCEVFDAQELGTEIILRHWQPGDRFQPIGMSCKVKLQDLFTNQKIPQAQRHQLLLATTASGEIFWVEGLRIAEQFKVRKKSNCVLQWQWQRLT